MSLRWRLFVTFSLIAVLCLGLVAVAATVILQNSRDRLTVEWLNTLATPIAVQARSLLRAQTTATDIKGDLQEQAQDNMVYILLCDSRGNIVSQIIPENGIEPLEISRIEFPKDLTDNPDGKFVTKDGQTFLYVVYPLVRLTAAQSLTRFEIMVLATPGTKASAVIRGLTWPFLIAGSAVLIISLITAILFARTIYLPINRVKDAAGKISDGQYDLKVPLDGPKEIKELATAFNQMAGQIKGSQSKLRYFVADVSHQLKSPLTSIHGFAQALLDGTASGDEDRQRAAAIISEESKRMKRQVDELLELARMQAGQLKMEKEQVNINELLEHCREVFEAQAEQKQVKVKIYADLLNSVQGDFDRLEQAFSNILDNAIKNSPHEDEIRIIGRNLDNHLVEVRVTDNGPGIPPEQLPYIFERFHQTGGTRSGFGLGLAIAREIIIAHGGTIEVFSEPGEGTEFAIRLPA